jgi:hypothetical protein
MNVILYVEEENSDWSNWYIELCENYPFNSNEESCKKEGEITRLIGTLNLLITGRDKIERRKEYIEENKEKLKNIKNNMIPKEKKKEVNII